MWVNKLLDRGLNKIKQNLKKAGALGISMRHRLFLFLVVIVITMMLGIIAILFFTGTFTVGIDESAKLLEKEEGELPSPVLYGFLENTKTLSPAERSVFDLYVQGYNAKEIAEILYLSINTIKTHNRRIYMKLDVSFRKELLLYVEMLKEAGKEL